ncbi:Abi family protein [Slackia isoflavoniconvertens]|uniref:Abi family protein n=1 Tax=Slackia isoflavoniconvertens TaxID=572010 RepID=UPI003AB82B38
MLKEFKTIAEQIRILETRGMRVGEEASTILLRENYYSIINGYKDPFLDKEAMQSSADDIYLKGTRFEWLYSLFKFDRELRRITFSYLIQAEAALKTATVYAFCEKHPNCSDYLDRSSFCSARDMLTPKTFKGNKMAQHSKGINKLMGILNKKLVVGPATRPFVEHYIAAYGEVPLWVLSNDLTFGNMSHFFQLMKRGDQNSVCKNLFKTTLRAEDDKRITPHEVLRAYDVLTHFRNLCAHDERLYCAQVDNDDYATMLKLMEVALPRDVVFEMKKDVETLLVKYSDELRVITVQDLRKQLGL